MFVLSRLILVGLFLGSFSQIIFAEDEMERKPLYSTAYDLVLKDKKDIGSVASHLISTYSPEDYHYVSLGRSPSVVSAYLRLLGFEVFNVPATGLRNLQPDADVDFRRVFEHLKRHLPSEITKPVVFIDYSISGLTFVNFERIIKKLREEKLLVFSKGFEFFILTKRSDYEDGIEKLYSESLEASHKVYFLDQISGALLDSLSSEFYDPFSEYHEFNMIYQDQNLLYENPVHGYLIRAVENLLILKSLGSFSQKSCKELL